MPLPVHVRFGRRVREQRLHAGMTQEDLAHRCGLFRTYMSNIERGVANPTLSVMQALADSLGVPLVELLGTDPTEGAPVRARDRKPPALPSRGRSR